MFCVFTLSPFRLLRARQLHPSPALFQSDSIRPDVVLRHLSGSAAERYYASPMLFYSFPVIFLVRSLVFMCAPVYL